MMRAYEEKLAGAEKKVETMAARIEGLEDVQDDVAGELGDLIERDVHGATLLRGLWKIKTKDYPTSHRRLAELMALACFTWHIDCVMSNFLLHADFRTHQGLSEDAKSYQSCQVKTDK